jgi:CRP-like cAMP-binding protein
VNRLAVQRGDIATVASYQAIEQSLRVGTGIGHCLARSSISGLILHARSHQRNAIALKRAHLSRVHQRNFADERSCKKTLGRASSVVDVASGDTILRKGDAGRELYLILDGAVEVTTKPNGTRRLLHTLGYGQFFGEGSFLLNQTRNTDASAIAPTKLLSIGAENFEKIRAKKPELAAKVLFNLSRVLCERLY